MFFILSPAKKMDFSRTIEGVETTTPVLMDDAAVLMKILTGLNHDDIRQLMGVSQAIADLTYARFQSLPKPWNQENSGPAVLAFDGDAYRGLDAGSLTAEDLEWVQERMAILSGLFGVLRPLDLIKPYRLEIATRLKTDRGSNLYQFWGDRITARINEVRRADDASVMLNLASGEYFKAIKPQILKGRVVTPVFHEVKPGQQGKVMSFAAKFARGLMARYIIDNRIEDPEAVKDFNLERYVFQPTLSSDDSWVFSRSFVPK